MALMRGGLSDSIPDQIACQNWIIDKPLSSFIEFCPDHSAVRAKVATCPP